MCSRVFRSLSFLLSALLLAGAAPAWAQEKPTLDGAFPVEARPGTPRLVDAEGREVPLERLPGILAKGNWRPEPVKDESGAVYQWRLVPTTPEEKALLLRAAQQAEERFAEEEAAKKARIDADENTIKILSTTEVLDGAGRVLNRHLPTSEFYQFPAQFLVSGKKGCSKGCFLFRHGHGDGLVANG